MEESEEPVQVIESCLVAPREATPTKELWLSPLDVSLASAGRISQVFLYRSGATFFDVPRLKEAMAKALVAYYPLVDRLGVQYDDNDGSSRVVEMMSCNGEGALFVVARSRCLTHQDLDFSKPSSPELKSMFVPCIEPAATLILAMHVTFLKCGAVVLGVSMHHAVVDGVSASHFMQTWSAVAVDTEDDHDDRGDVPHLEGPGDRTETPLRRGSKHLRLPECRRVAVYERRTPAAARRLSFPIHVQRYLTPPLPTRYIGNACISLCATGAAGDIIASEALPSVAARISGAMARTDDELVRSAIDYVELADEDTWPRCRGGVLPETDLRIVSWLNMPFGLDLGCGGPQVMTRADTLPRGLVYLIDDDHRGVAVVVHGGCKYQ